MTGVRLYCCLLVVAIFFGCGSSSQRATSPPSVQQEPKKDELALSPTPPERVASATEHARKWNPQFVSTGGSSGIMAEFTGVKKDKKLRARYSAIELWDQSPDSAAGRDTTSNSRKGTSIKLIASINDLRQAFFKVKPGTYLFRHTRLWADTSYIRDIEVREGNYSVIKIDVYSSWSSKSRQLSDTSEEK